VSAPSDIWAHAGALHRQGKLAEALSAYDEILRADPRNAAALHYSGVALYQAGKLGESLDRLRASVAIKARRGRWSNLGGVAGGRPATRGDRRVE
jgi:tetratricopeptide (TPR) repeat protein